MSEEVFVIFVPSEGLGRGYVCGADTLGAITKDNVEFAKQFVTIEDAENYIVSVPDLYQDASFLEIVPYSVARAKDDQEYEAEREELL